MSRVQATRVIVTLISDYAAYAFELDASPSAPFGAINPPAVGLANMSLSWRFIRVRQRQLWRRRIKLLLQHATAMRWKWQRVVLQLVISILTVTAAASSLIARRVQANLGITGADCVPFHIVGVVCTIDLIVLLLLIHYVTPPSLSRCLDQSSSPRSVDGKINIFVRGAGSKEVLLVVSPYNTVSDVLKQLRRRHLIPDLSRIHHYIFYPPHGHGPLNNGDVLNELGVGNLSMLHLRTCILGGTRTHGPSLSSNSASARSNSFTRSSGKFSSKYPERWEPVSGGSFRCVICSDDKIVEPRYIKGHEDSRSHQRHLRLYEKRQKNGPSKPSTSTNRSFSRSQSESIQQVREPLLDLLQHIAIDPYAESGDDQWVDQETGTGLDWQSHRLDFDYHHQAAPEARAIAQAASQLREYLLDEGAIDQDSADEHDERSSDSETEEEQTAPSMCHTAPRTRKHRLDPSQETAWYPWPDKETCVLDVLRHLPRCAFSDKQNSAIHWALRVLGVKDVPSERTMKDVRKVLQKLCGVESIRYPGALGHIYYVNDFAAIVAQEMANPSVRPHLRFIPEDAGSHLSEAWQGKRWLEELDPDLLTQMVRIRNQDFYVFEPVLLQDGRVCMPIRWFTRGRTSMARAWPMIQVAGGWIVQKYAELDIDCNDLLLSFPHFAHSHDQHRLSNPHDIIGIQMDQGGGIAPWTKTDSTKGNPWRVKAAGHRVVAFPIWLYCDDTSGNLSKKWNKHNSFLFTAAGLPRRVVHREFNIHFLSTSNLAPPLEMLDGIVDQLRVCQDQGIWAWDSELMELVLVIPSVLAMLGDNPMQSEIACHIGLMGKFFCRACWVMKGDSEEDADINDNEDARASDTSSIGSAGSDVGSAQHKDNGKRGETLAEMVDRVRRFMKMGTLRNKAESQAQLASQFEEAKRVGGMAEVLRMRTRSGIKDTFQVFFLDKLFSISSKRGKSQSQKQSEMANIQARFPEHITSPVWRIKDFDPHSDTPVEILHVILLGFVKYLWRDAISRLKDSQKPILIARLSSLNVSGLGIPKLAGHTLVNYSGSLTGRDFRTIAQAAPFVLHDFLSKEAIDVWIALGALIPLVWKPEIDDIDLHVSQLQKAIDHFLNCTCQLTPRWFNKPKFHIILHLPEHIRRFGPAMLFATEGFESYNAIIRTHSVLSNRHAPSRDIARSMASSNRVRHLLSRGFFRQWDYYSAEREDPEPATDGMSPWIQSMRNTKTDHWRTIGLAPLELLEDRDFIFKMIGFEESDEADYFTATAGICSQVGKSRAWTATKTGTVTLPSTHMTTTGTAEFRTPKRVILGNGDSCEVDDWVVWQENPDSGIPHTYTRLGLVCEILQRVGSAAERSGKADYVLIQRAIVGEAHGHYHMPQLSLLEEFILVSIPAIKCTVNVQHNCVDNHCNVTRSRPVYQERERTSECSNAITHLRPNDYILNTAQMRDATCIDPFRTPAPTLNRDHVIHTAAILELQVAKERQKAKTTAKQAKAGSKGKGVVRAARRVGSVEPSEARAPSSHRNIGQSHLRHALSMDFDLHGGRELPGFSITPHTSHSESQFLPQPQVYPMLTTFHQDPSMDVDHPSVNYRYDPDV